MIWMEVQGTWLLVTDIIAFRPHPAYDLRTEVIMRSGTEISVACTVEEFRELILGAIDAVNPPDDEQAPDEEANPELEFEDDPPRHADAWGSGRHSQRMAAEEQRKHRKRQWLNSLTKAELTDRLQLVGVGFQTAKPTKAELVELAVEHLA